MPEHGPQLSLSLARGAAKPLLAPHLIAEVAESAAGPADAELDVLLALLVESWEREGPTLTGAKEAATEDRWIRPVVEALGFACRIRPPAHFAGRPVELDFALYADDQARLDAEGRPGLGQFENAAAILEAKRFDRDLDSRRDAGALSEDPVAQVIHYLTASGVRWAVLTNGRRWRLYGAEGDLVEGACHEVDLVALVEARDREGLRRFLTVFGQPAFTAGPDGRSRLDRLLTESLTREVDVGAALERQVFAAVPLVAQGLLGEDERTPEALAQAFEHALVVLFRLLFCLHAEDRGLLPVDQVHYRHYSVRERRGRLATDLDGGRRFSSRSDDLYNDLRALFGIVDRGDPDLGVNEYDGGLFDNAARPWLAGRTVPDALFAQALDRLFRVAGQQVDYAGLSVRHLGTIYERLLAFRLVDAGVHLALEASDERHDSGSYFTPEFVVDEIVEATLGPLLDLRSAEIAGANLDVGAALDAFLGVRVLDPAMGSGHFLISAAAFIAQHIANDPSYAEGELSRSELMRLVAERCIYGVDLNPMAVELARVALWLATVRGDRPLTFLGNLRAGNSLVGVSVAELLTGGETVFAAQLATEAHELLDLDRRSRELGDRSAEETHEKQRLASLAASLREPLERLADERLAGAFTGGAGRPFFHWDLEFPEVFLDDAGVPRPDGGFDAVVGNPPYVRIQRLGRELAAYARRAYESAAGSFDVYVPFIERGLDLLGPRGRLGYIVPSKFQRLDYGERLRGALADGRVVERIIDFQDAQLFPGATNYTCILVLDRAGSDELSFERVGGSQEQVRRVLTGRRAVEHYPATDLTEDPWVLATGEEAALLRALSERGERLEEATGQIFQGLITSADPVYIVEDRGRVGGLQRVYSKAGDREVDLEPDLLHPLASGPDVERYAFEPLGSMLLFPYRRAAEAMELVPWADLEALPRTAAYLCEHEAALRGRERGKMDHERWWAFGRHQGLGLHESPKLGVAATVRRLEVAADLRGAVFFHNVRVNGVLPLADERSLEELCAALNSRPLDWVFRRRSSPLANGYFTANKQFISGLPVPPSSADLADLGSRLIALAERDAEARGGFLRWLADSVGAPLSGLRGITAIRGFAELPFPAFLAAVQQNDAAVARDLRSRAFVDALRSTWQDAASDVGELRTELRPLERAADELVCDLFELSAAQRELVNAEYPD
jgi:hypothetical protein